MTVGRKKVLSVFKIILLVSIICGLFPTAVFAADTTNPTTPTGLVAIPSSTMVTLSWNKSTDNVAVSGYQIYRNGVVVGASYSTNYTDTSVSPGITYNYSVKAFDTSGNYSSAITIVVRTKSTP